MNRPATLHPSETSSPHARMYAALIVSPMVLGCGSDVAAVAGEAEERTCADQTVEEYCAAHGFPLHYPDSICDPEIAEHVSGKAECTDGLDGVPVQFDQIELGALGVRLYYSHESGRLEFVLDYPTLLAGCLPSFYESLACSGVGIICE